MSGSVASAVSRNWCVCVSVSLLGMYLHLAPSLFCWSSAQRSFMADNEPRRETEGLMQSFWREDRGMCFTGSLPLSPSGLGSSPTRLSPAWAG